MKTLLTLLLLTLAAAAAAKTPGEIEVGGTLREARLAGLSGPAQALSEFRGAPLIINFWASYCGPCRVEMGSLDRLARRLAARRIRVIGISVDDYPDRALAFLRETRASFPQFIDSALTMENMLGANRIPLTVLVDAQGRVLAKVYGAKEWDGPEMRELIERTFRTGR